MDTQVESRVMDTKFDTSSQTLKSLLSSLTEQSVQTKTLMQTVRTVLKDFERQSKELEKLKNKKSRSTTERKNSGVPSGITKPVAISDDLARFLGVEPGTLVPRNEVTKGVSAYVRKFELSDPTNKQKFVLDDRVEAKILRTLLGNPAEEVTYFNLQRYLKQHYLHVEVLDQKVEEKKIPESTKKSSKSEPKPEIEPASEESVNIVPESSVPEVGKVLKKKIVMKKKVPVSDQLTEES